MNTLFQKIAAGIGFSLTVGLISCQEDKLVIPTQPLAETSQAVNDIISPTIPKKYTLIKHGQNTLSYYSDGRLRKVSYGLALRGSTNGYTLYTYNTQSIVASSYYGDNTLIQVQTYLLDANTGRCYESQQVDYVQIAYNLTVTQESNFLYAYDEKGRLKTYSNKKYTYDRTEFAYNTDGDLSKLTHYGKPISNASPLIVAEFTFAYDQPTGDPILTDFSPINVESANLPDPYLKVFGKSSKHLVKLITEKGSLGGKYYTYTLNADGYVTARKEYSLFNGAVVDTKAYDYLVTNLTFQL